MNRIVGGKLYFSVKDMINYNTIQFLSLEIYRKNLKWLMESSCFLSLKFVYKTKMWFLNFKSG